MVSRGIARDIKFSITYRNMSLPQDQLIILFFDRKGRLTLKDHYFTCQGLTTQVLVDLRRTLELEKVET